MIIAIICDSALAKYAISSCGSYIGWILNDRYVWDFTFIICELVIVEVDPKIENRVCTVLLKRIKYDEYKGELDTPVIQNKP